MHSVKYTAHYQDRNKIEMASVVSMLIALLVAVCSGMDVSSLIPTIAAFGMAALKLMPSANRISTALNQVAYYEPSLDKLLESLQLIEREKEEKEKEVGTNENATFARIVSSNIKIICGI